MKNFLHVALGILTSVGGFLEIGSLTTSMQAGAEFGYRLVWIIALGTLCAITLTEMAGRFSAVSQRTIGDALRERFGFRFFFVTLLGIGLSSLVVLAAEFGGLAVAMEIATGVTAGFFIAPMGLLVWLILWKGRFGLIEYGVAGLGLVALSFAVAASRGHPSGAALLASLVPSKPTEAPFRYWYLAVNILGATLTPYLFYFYSSGAIEDRWDVRHLGPNRVVALIGMLFGGILSAAVLVVSATALKGVRLEDYWQASTVLIPTLGQTGFWLFVVSLWIGCLGATLEITLALAYLVAEGFGWQWGENIRPRNAARFALTSTILVIAGTALSAAGIDVLTLTNVAMAMSSAILPLALCPFLLLMNDRRYLGSHCNGWLANGSVLLIVCVAVALSLVSIPLTIIAGSG